MTYAHVSPHDNKTWEPLGLAYVSVGAAYTKRIDADPFLAILRERSRNHRHLELLLRKGN